MLYKYTMHLNYNFKEYFVRFKHLTFVKLPRLGKISSCFKWSWLLKFLSAVPSVFWRVGVVGGLYQLPINCPHKQIPVSAKPELWVEHHERILSALLPHTPTHHVPLNIHVCQLWVRRLRLDKHPVLLAIRTLEFSNAHR